MLKVSHATLIFLSGAVWMIVGCFLLPLGLNFVIAALLRENATLSHPVLSFISNVTNGLEESALIWIVFALLIGFLKGRTVFAKSVRRSVDRIHQLPNPSSLSKIYTPAYYILLASMVLIGVLMRFTPIDVRGGVDIAVGSALINGAILYFREAWKARRQPSHSR